MSHPDPAAPPDLRPIEPGEVWENPVTLERAVIVELPWMNDEGRVVADLTALPGARVAGEHLHPALHERFSVQSGELTMLRDGQRSVLRAGEEAHIEPGVWHDWWNAGDVDAIVRVEITPGERFAHMIETLFGLAREGHVNKRGMPRSAAAGALRDRVLRRRPSSASHRLPFSASCSARSRRSPAAAATGRPTRACRERPSPPPVATARPAPD